MVDIEDLTEEELDELHRFYEKVSKLSKKDAEKIRFIDIK